MKFAAVIILDACQHPARVACGNAVIFVFEYGCFAVNGFDDARDIYVKVFFIYGKRFGHAESRIRFGIVGIVNVTRMSQRQFRLAGRNDFQRKARRKIAPDYFYHVAHRGAGAQGNVCAGSRIQLRRKSDFAVAVSPVRAERAFGLDTVFFLDEHAVQLVVEARGGFGAVEVAVCIGKRNGNHIISRHSGIERNIRHGGHHHTAVMRNGIFGRRIRYRILRSGYFLQCRAVSGQIIKGKLALDVRRRDCRGIRRYAYAARTHVSRRDFERRHGEAVAFERRSAAADAKRGIEYSGLIYRQYVEVQHVFAAVIAYSLQYDGTARTNVYIVVSIRTVPDVIVDARRHRAYVARNRGNRGTNLVIRGVYVIVSVSVTDQNAYHVSRRIDNIARRIHGVEDHRDPGGICRRVSADIQGADGERYRERAGIVSYPRNRQSTRSGVYVLAVLVRRGIENVIGAVFQFSFRNQSVVRIVYV